MEKTFLKLFFAVVTLAGIAYGLYRLYAKYCGAKIANDGKFKRNMCDLGCHFDDDDEYLEDDDVYYFDSGIDHDETAEDFIVSAPADVDEAETAMEIDASVAEEVMPDEIEDIFKDEEN